MRTSALARRDPEKSAMAMDYQPAELENYPGYHIRRLQQIAVAVFMEETQEFGVTPCSTRRCLPCCASPAWTSARWRG